MNRLYPFIYINPVDRSKILTGKYVIGIRDSGYMSAFMIILFPL
jgi:hypothetical protein